MSADERPHSRACGISRHEHGPDCHSNCPTCGGKKKASEVSDDLTAVARLTTYVAEARYETTHVADCKAVLAILAAAKAEALREAADEWTQGAWADAPRRADRAQERIATAQHVGDWLRDRADRAQPPGERPQREDGERDE